VAWNLSLAATGGWSTSIPLGAWKLETGTGIDMSTLTSVSLSSTLDTSISAVTELSLNSNLNTTVTTGLNFSHTANGTWSAGSKLPMSLKSDMNFKAEAAMILEAKAGIQMDLKAPIVTIGASPSEPTVMGTQISTWLQNFCSLFTQAGAAFLGTGNLGAPVPMNPAIVSGIAALSAQIPLLTSKTITVSP
jgi:hypothetical protein